MEGSNERNEKGLKHHKNTPQTTQY